MTQMMLSAPRLETDRLILRGPEESDFDAVKAFMTSERTKFIGGKTTSEWEAWRGFLGSIGHWALRGYGFFTVLDKLGNRLGRVGLLNHVMWPEPELGWHMFDGSEGKGFAYEAAMAIRDWAAKERKLDRLISQIHPDNARSIALAERMGATLEKETTLLGDPCLIYRHPSVAGGAA